MDAAGLCRSDLYLIAGSLWGNYNELAEVIELSRQGNVKHSLT